MVSKRNYPEVDFLEQYRITLANARSSEKIAEKLAAVGYDPDKITVGDVLFKKAYDASHKARSEKHKLRAAYRKFTSLKETLFNTYSIHRSLAKVVFKKDETTGNRLGLNTNIPKSYSGRLELVKKFYTEAASDQDIVNLLSELKLDGEKIAAQLDMISKLEKAKVEHIRKRGESKDATKNKEEAFNEIYEWMKDFYTVAKIALKDEPAFMVSFGIIKKKRR